MPPRPWQTNRLCSAALLVIACGVLGCGGRQDRPVLVVATCDTAGWIVPCGCSAGQSGGLPRRGTFIKNQQKLADLLFVEIGGAPSGVSEYDRIKFEAILQGEKVMSVAAHNLGAAEAALGPTYLRRLGSNTQIPWVSCNVRDPDGELLAPPTRIAIAGDTRVAFIGLLSPSLAPEGVRVDPAKPALLAALKTVQGQYDLAIALAYLPEDELRELAAGVPELDAVLGGPTGQSLPPESIGPTLLASVTNKGKFLAKLCLTDRGAECELIELGVQWQDDPRQVDNLQAYYKRLEEADLTTAQTALATARAFPWPKEHQITGSQSCRECHTRDCEAWDTTKHAHAWETLQEKSSHVDPYCQQCHTTGYGAPGGFVSAKLSADRLGVGCESCHGPSKLHAENPRIATMFPAKGQCVECHDQENSPGFDYDKYWKQIMHGYRANDQARLPRQGARIH